MLKMRSDDSNFDPVLKKHSENIEFLLGQLKVPSKAEDDVRQAGGIALWEACHKYDVKNSCKIWTYAKKGVRGAMLRTLRSNTDTVKLTDYKYRKISKNNELKEEKSFLSKKEENEKSHYIPIEKTHGIEKTIGKDHLTIDPELDWDRELDIQKALAMLSKEERKLIELHYGFGKNMEHSVIDLANLYGVTRTTIYKRLDDAQEKMKFILKDYME